MGEERNTTKRLPKRAGCRITNTYRVAERKRQCYRCLGAALQNRGNQRMKWMDEATPICKHTHTSPLGSWGRQTAHHKYIEAVSRLYSKGTTEVFSRSRHAICWGFNSFDSCYRRHSWRHMLQHSITVSLSSFSLSLLSLLMSSLLRKGRGEDAWTSNEFQMWTTSEECKTQESKTSTCKLEEH